jgi:hypothetical protein
MNGAPLAVTSISTGCSVFETNLLMPYQGVMAHH